MNFVKKMLVKRRLRAVAKNLFRVIDNGSYSRSNMKCDFDSNGDYFFRLLVQYFSLFAGTLRVKLIRRPGAERDGIEFCVYGVQEWEPKGYSDILTADLLDIAKEEFMRYGIVLIGITRRQSRTDFLFDRRCIRLIELNSDLPSKLKKRGAYIVVVNKNGDTIPLPKEYSNYFNIENDASSYGSFLTRKEEQDLSKMKGTLQLTS